MMTRVLFSFVVFLWGNCWVICVVFVIYVIYVISNVCVSVLCENGTFLCDDVIVPTATADMKKSIKFSCAYHFLSKKLQINIE